MILQKLLSALDDDAVAAMSMVDIYRWSARWALNVTAEHAGVHRKLVQIGMLAQNVARSEALRRSADRQRVFRELVNLRNAINRAMTGMSEAAADSYVAHSYLSLAATQVLVLPTALASEYLVECNVLVETTGIVQRSLPECAKADPDNTGLIMVANQQVLAIPAAMYPETKINRRLANEGLRSMYGCTRAPGYRGYVFVWCCATSDRNPLDTNLQPSTVRHWFPNICPE